MKKWLKFFLIFSVSITLIIICLIPFIVFSNAIDLWVLSEYVHIGSSLASMLAPVLAVIGSILVYFAFRTQIDANNEIKKQFVKQNFDQHFFRLVDSLENKINNYSVSDNNDKKTTIFGFNILPFFVKEVKSQLTRQRKILGRKILVSKPDIVTDNIFKNFIEELDRARFPSVESLKSEFLGRNELGREEFLNHLEEPDFQMYNDNREATVYLVYAETFDELYYDMTPIFHKNLFRRISFKLFLTYDGFFEPYFKIFTLLINHISNTRTLQTENNFYLDFLRNKLTVHEKILIFLYIGSGKANLSLKEKYYCSIILKDIEKHETILRGVNKEKFYVHFNKVLGI